MRGRFFRHSDRASFKTLQFLALFRMGIFLGFLTFAVLVLTDDYVVRSLSGSCA